MKGQRVVVVGNIHQLGDGVDGAERVRDVDRREHRGVVRNELAGVIHVEGAVVRNSDVLDVGTGALADLLPRDQRGVVFHLRQHDLVFGTEFVQAPE